MEYSGRHILDNRTEETLKKLNLQEPDCKIYKKVLKNWDSIAKPLDGMGRFENGIVEEGISQSGQEVTAAVAAQMGRGASSVGKMAAKIGAGTIPVDIGINGKEQIAGVRNKKVRCGTRNFRKEPAMTREETVRAIFTGIEIVEECKRKGYQILATGEMGIGNTTTSSAVAAALLRCGADEVTGRGAGLCDEKQMITEAVKKYKLYEAEPLIVLQTVGGLDIAGLVGICIGGGVFHIPIVLDGVISMVAALLSERIVQGTIGYLIPSHKGKEPAVEKLMKELGLEPVIDGRMALGEGTGAVMMLSLLEMTLCVYRKRTLFSDIKVEQYERYLS